jgi:hypothetical protein
MNSILKPHSEPTFRPAKAKLVDLCIEEAMYNPNVALTLQLGRTSEFAGMGLRKPDHFTVTYQRLWEYVVTMEIYKDAMVADMRVTGNIPNIGGSFSGVGFDEES